MTDPNSSPTMFEKFAKAVEIKGHKTEKQGAHKENFFELMKNRKSHDKEFKERIKKAGRGAERLRDVFVAPLAMVPGGYELREHAKSKEEIAFIESALSESFVIAHLNRHSRRSFVHAFEKYTAKEGEEVIRQGEQGDFFYIIETGKMKFVVDGTEVGKGEAKDMFGELALLYGCPRAATCICEVESKLWRIDRNTFRKILATYTIRGDSETIGLLRKVPFMKDLDERQLTKIAYSLGTVTVEKGEYIGRKGDKGNNFYIIKEGRIKATELEIGGCKYDDTILGPGDSFGERMLLGEPFPGSGVALEKTEMLFLARESFVQLFGDFELLLKKSMDKKQLMAVPIAGKPHLDEEDVHALTEMIIEVEYKMGHVFFREGATTSPTLYILRSGKVKVESSPFLAIGLKLNFVVGLGESNTIGEDGYFGADTLENINEGKAEAVAKYTVTAIEDCKVGVLTMHAIWSVMGPKGGNKGGIPFCDLQKYRILGAGTFGQVWLVSKKGTKDAYALKVQNKRQLIEYGQAAGVVREKSIMAKLDHPFIIKLVNSYKDEHSVYMLTELYQGGELQSILHGDLWDGVTEEYARFYAGGVLEGLSYMHRRHIVYRDLKPENVLLDKDGYTVIVDLGFAKFVAGKTYTFCGTPIYIAPEVIAQSGHDKGADLWSWGVMLYEMIVGITPFYDHKVDQLTLFKRISKGKYSFPSGDFMSNESKDLIRKILVTNPKERLGCFAGADMDIRRHPWFEEIDLKKLSKKEIKAPWKPKLADPLDVSNFDSWEHLEKKAEKKEKPLSAKEQKLFDNF